MYLHYVHLGMQWISLKRPGAACSVKMRPDALLWHPSCGMACKGLCTLAGRDWADLLETAARADLTHRDPREDEPAAVRDWGGPTCLTFLHATHKSRLDPSPVFIERHDIWSWTF